MRNCSKSKNNKRSRLFNGKKKEELDELEENVREIIVEKDNGFNTIEVIVIILISIVFGGIVGYMLNSSKFLGVPVSKEVVEIINTYDTILENYYEDVDSTELVEAAVSGMINLLDDPYSLYMDSGNSDSFLESVNGSFVGIGINVQWDGKVFKIIEVFDNSPAEEVGIKEGDVIFQVENTDVSSLNLNELSNLIKGKKGAVVKIVVLRDEKQFEIEVERKLIEIPSVDSTILNDGIGYVKIDSFSSATSKQFSNHLDNLEDKKITSLIIDVRDNPGGKLTQVNNILDVFFDKNTVLYKIVTKDKTDKVYASKNDKKVYPIVVLVNHESASAAEILAACFQENYKYSTIVGEVTYGKGTIQNTLKLSSGSIIKYTTQKWLTPKGNWIEKKGIIPDEVVSQNDDYITNPVIENDLQLKKALEILKK